jgi:hypothetical protein
MSNNLDTTLAISVADPEISKRGGALLKEGASPLPEIEKNHIFFVSNIEFYYH